ncbi:2-(1,2-epoxy-1,2-dihydrophenyl)acetyl-CoA isomerase [Rhodoplanes elegans]|uniref:2-(1,2-epoxy-1,2-dihydrophenyl)acetyl-CoA isomerase n=1 Tax=Rhodoplanes elegans TaxID=29408 RepID=A0A327KMV9_9BRAD|nr:2-(1,2-epoxy-1,2-dihydrophenyl)acetyl-CoA isomerase PaaG [Rhodoplanes elegans]MBK5959307.1 2-(1,2-epoxy-1,2-dihydrophenyl)acetyl-CoA isomerase [Rhodoplanes elegans]RAI40230.1 2-(1,2-epoxy-1,2-dihydrophenyl)acetyl-CoA isomerase [Rhodoplanes elegans]
MEPSVLVDRRDGWVRLVLNRPDRLNSFNEEMHKRLAAAFDAAGADEACRAVLLTGAGRGFCAGQDLSDRVGPADLGATIDAFYNPLVRRIRALNKPVVCAVNGVAAGAGANIALACDIVLAARSAKFIQAFSKIGLVPDSGGTFFLPRLIGEARARALAMLAEPLPAEKAEAWGLIWKVFEDDALAAEAEKLVAHLATQPTVGLALTKQAFAASATNDLDAQLDLERDLQRKAGSTPDYAEGVRAFLDKRTPNFTGRSS